MKKQIAVFLVVVCAQFFMNGSCQATPPVIDLGVSVHIYSLDNQLLSEVEPGQQVQLTIAFTPFGELGVPFPLLKGRELFFIYRLQGDVSQKSVEPMIIATSNLTTSSRALSYTVPEGISGRLRFIGQVDFQGVRTINSRGVGDYQISEDPAISHDMFEVAASCVSCHTVGSGSWEELYSLHTSDCQVCHESSDQAVQGAISAGMAGTAVDCQSCHDSEPASWHHLTAEAQAGNCSWCHQDPRSTWTTATPGDNGGSSLYPTQLACVTCHLTFHGDNSIDISRTATDAVQHALPAIAAGFIDNYGICFSCHDGSSGVAVAPFHGKPLSLPTSNRCTAGNTPGRGTFNLHYDEFNRASSRNDKGCRNYNGDYRYPVTGYDYLIPIPTDNASVPVFPSL